MKNNIRRAIALLAALNCIIGPLYFSAIFGANQGLFPLPFWYFVEISLLGAAALWLVERPSSKGWYWGVAGVFAAFVVLGAWSIGGVMVPAFLLVSALALFDSFSNKDWWPLLYLPGFGAAQAVLMLNLVKIF